jgi:hypothetical protein
MFERRTCLAPVITWLNPDECPDRTDLAAFELEIERLVHDLWWRLPQVVSTIIAGRLECVRLVLREEERSCCYDGGAIVVFLDKQGLSSTWKATVIWSVIWGFGMAFLEALFVQMPREDLQALPIIDELRGTRRVGRLDEILSLFKVIEGQGSNSDEVISQMAEALGLAWGFGKEIAQVVDLDEIRQPHEQNCNELGAELGRVFRVLEQRLAKERPKC